MSKILMLYASATGNTELMAEVMVDYLEDRNDQVVIKTFDFDPIDVEEMLDYDAILIGTHTWDDGGLPYEIEDFYEQLESVDVTGKVIGVFGSADSFYDTYGGAVDLFYDHLENLGAVLVPQRLKVDLEPDREDIERCVKFVGMLCEMIEVK